MRHAGTQEIKTPRLLLRRLLPEDADMMYRNWASDPVVTRYLTWEPHTDPAFTRALLTEWAALYANPDYYQWCLAEKAGGQVFGSISIFPERFGGGESAPDEWPALNVSDGVWAVGYCIGRAWWGRGYMTEALRAVADYWFTRTDGAFLVCSHATANPASGRVMQKAGFVYDHDAPCCRLDGTLLDGRSYCLTRERYRALYHPAPDDRKDIF